MLKHFSLAAVVLLAIQGMRAQAETDLGITLEQGEEGRPVVTDVRRVVGGWRTLGSYLELQPGDVIITAHSDPIELGDGTYSEDWDIRSISNLRWVLKRTISKVGLTVKRGDSYVRAIAIYRNVLETEITPSGRPRVIKKGVWTLSGPSRVEAP